MYYYIISLTGLKQEKFWINAIQYLVTLVKVFSVTLFAHAMLKKETKKLLLKSFATTKLCTNLVSRNSRCYEDLTTPIQMTSTIAFGYIGTFFTKSICVWHLSLYP